jgi:hypothetical protein
MLENAQKTSLGNSASLAPVPVPIQGSFQLSKCLWNVYGRDTSILFRFLLEARLEKESQVPVAEISRVRPEGYIGTEAKVTPPFNPPDFSV